MSLAKRFLGPVVRAALPDEARLVLAKLHQLDRLERLDQLQRLEALDQLHGLDRLDQLAALDQLQQLNGLGQLARLEDLERELTAIRHGVTDHDTRLDRLNRALADPALRPQRPVHGVAVPAGPAFAHWLNRCRTVQHYLNPVTDLRLLDVGSSAGFVSSYFAARGATVEGWEPDAAQAELARAAEAVSGLGVTYRTQDLDQDTVDVIPAAAIDAVLVLGTGARSWSERLGSQAEEVMARLVDRVPNVIVETRADDHAGLGFFARLGQVEGGVDIHRLGRLADISGGSDGSDGDGTAGAEGGDAGGSTLWALRRERASVTVNGTDYPYRTRSNEAYDRSPMTQHGAGRRYYFDDTHVVKEYRLDGDHRGVNRSQILTEINVLSQLDGVATVPELVDFELVPERARIVMRRIPGSLLSDLLERRPEPAAVRRIATDVLRALVELERHGLSHNDVRSWNVLFDGRTAALIDYGLVSNLAAEVDVRSLLWVIKAVLTGEREDFDPRTEALPERRLFAVDPELDKLHQAVAAGSTSPRAVLASIDAD